MLPKILSIDTDDLSFIEWILEGISPLCPPQKAVLIAADVDGTIFLPSDLQFIGNKQFPIIAFDLDPIEHFVNSASVLETFTNSENVLTALFARITDILTRRRIDWETILRRWYPNPHGANHEGKIVYRLDYYPSRPQWRFVLSLVWLDPKKQL